MLQELYLASSGEGSYRAIIDLEETRWYFFQEMGAPAAKRPHSPFDEPRTPTLFQRAWRYLPESGETVVGFGSPFLWFGPLTLEGAYAAMESPLEQRPFSAAWEAPSRTRLSSSRSPPKRVGVGLSVGPCSLSHTRRESVHRTVSSLRLGDPRSARFSAELLAGQTDVGPAGEESWTFDEPPLVGRTGYHTGARLSHANNRWQANLLLISSVSPLDPPGHVALARLVASPLGLCVGVLTRGYRDGGFDLRRPGLAVALARKAPGRRGHTLGWALRGVKSESPGVARESSIEGEGSARWKWRGRSATNGTRRLGAEATLTGERSTTGRSEGEAAVELSAGEERTIGNRGALDGRIEGGLAAKEEFGRLQGRVETRLGYRDNFWELQLSWESRVTGGAGSKVVHAPGAKLLLYPGGEDRAELGIRLSVDEPAPWSRLRRLSLTQGDALLTVHGRYRPRIRRAASK